MVIAGCFKEQSRNSLLQRAEQTALTSPYNALHMLAPYTADSFPNERERHLYHLIVSENIHRMGITEASDSAIAACRLYCMEHRDKSLYGRALLHNGITLYSNGVRYRGIEMMKQAEQEAHGSTDSHFLYDLYETLGTVNNESGNGKLAMAYFRKALATAKSTGNTRLTARATNMIADAFDALGLPDSMYKYIREFDHRDIEDARQHAAMLTNHASYRLYRGDTALAERQLVEAQNVFQLYKTQKLLGDIHAGRGQMEQACSLWYEAIFSPSSDIGAETCHRLTDHFCKTGQYKRAAYISKKLNLTYETALYGNKVLETASVQTRYDTMVADRQARRRQHIMLHAVGLLAAIILLLVLYHRRKIRSVNKLYAQELRLYNSACAELAELQRRKEHDSRLIAEKTSEVEQLQQRLSEYHPDHRRPDKWNMQEQLLQAPEVMRLHHMAARSHKASDEDWAGLYPLVTAHLPELMARLNATDSLSFRETNVCLLIRLRFIPSEIAILTDTSPQAITNMRVRMLFKIFGERGGARDFDNRIKDI